MLNVIVIGMGPIGFAAARAIRAEKGIKLSGLVDVDPAKQGKTLAELGELQEDQQARDQSVEPRVTHDLSAAVGSGADVAVVATASQFDRVVPTIRECLAHKLAVVSSCEEMAWPWYRHDALADQVDKEAADAGRAVLGTGVNPGFVMDRLSVVLSSMVRRVTAVQCVRRLDASLRRKPLQAKVGATMSVEEFNALAAEGGIGHKGLCESVAMIAAGLGRQVTPGSVKETLEPVVADRAIPSALGLIEPGRVAGIHNVGEWSCDDLKITLDLTMAVGTDDPKDVVRLEGPVSLKCKIPGAVPGDSATVAALLNNIAVVHEAKPGLRTMLDVPCSGCHNMDFVS